MHISINPDEFFADQIYQLYPAHRLRTHLRFPLPTTSTSTTNLISMLSIDFACFCTLFQWNSPLLCLTSCVKFIHIVVCCFRSFILIAGYYLFHSPD